MKIAITGGIATGKSTVAGLLGKCLGTDVLDADLICRDLLVKGQLGWHGVREAWGERFMDQDGQIDRVLLRETIFSEKNIRLELERILHPLVRDEINCVSVQKRRKGEAVLIEVPLLYEVGWLNDFDWIVTVFATENMCVQRIVARDKTTEKGARRVLSVQMPIVCKALQADSVIDNSGLWAYTCLQIYHLARFLRKSW
jgi:dephospho-CoA kinase